MLRLQILPSLLGNYIQPAGLRTLSASFSGHKIELANLEFKPESLDHFNLPIKVAYGRVGSLRINIPGGALGLLSRVYTEPIRIHADQVHIIVDKSIQSSTEVARRVEHLKASALKLDATLYRQALLDLAQSELDARSLSASTSKGPTLIEAIINNLQVILIVSYC